MNSSRRAQSTKLLRRWKAIRERWSKMSPAQKIVWRRRLALFGISFAAAATIATGAYLVRRSAKGSAAQPTVIEKPLERGGKEIISPITLGDEGARMEVLPRKGESSKEFEGRVKRAREIISTRSRIGEYLYFKIGAEFQALKETGVLKEVQDEIGRKSELRYSLSNVKKDVRYNEETGKLDVPPGSLLIITYKDSGGEEHSTCVLTKNGRFIYYAYPDGLHGSLTNPNNTGFTGSLEAFLQSAGTARVSGYIPPNP